jgi:hypothetical protein
MARNSWWSFAEDRLLEARLAAGDDDARIAECLQANGFNRGATAIAERRHKLRLRLQPKKPARDPDHHDVVHIRVIEEPSRRRSREGQTHARAHRDHLDPIAAFKILPGAVEDCLGIGRHEGNTSGAQRPDGVPDGLGRGEGRNPGAGGHLAGGGGIVLVRGQAGGRLNQTHDFHLRRAEQRGLVRNIVRPAGGEGGVVALAETPDMYLERRWEQARVFHLNGGVGRGNQDPKMANHRKTSWQQRGTTPDVWPATMA